MDDPEYKRRYIAYMVERHIPADTAEESYSDCPREDMLADYANDPEAAAREVLEDWHQECCAAWGDEENEA